MATFSKHFQMQFLEWKFLFVIQISLKLIPENLLDNKIDFCYNMVKYNILHK